MKSRLLVAGLAFASLALMSGCAGVNASKSIETATATKSVADDAKIDPAQLQSTNGKLEEAQKQQENGEDEQAIALAEQSTLEYKLAIATAERDEAVKEDERLEKELRGDVERKLIYQSIRDQETKNGEAQ